MLRGKKLKTLLADIVLYLSRNGLLKWMPDERYLRIVYRLRMHKKLDLETPSTFSEKIQWLKLHDRREIYRDMVDKRTAKEYAAERIGAEYIIPTLAVWDSPEAIDLKGLPERFVLKVNHDSGGVVICRDKAGFDLDAAKKKLRTHFSNNGYWYGREWPYKDIRPCVLAEELLLDDASDQADRDLPDYKFYCFDGEPKYCQVICDRRQHETIDFFDMDWGHQEFVGLNAYPNEYSNAPRELPCPPCFDEMKRAAKILSRGMRFIRVDFYAVGGRMYFGEMTFYPASGLGTFTPEVWNRRLGDMIRL